MTPEEHKYWYNDGPSPHYEKISQVLADGEWHEWGEVLVAAMHEVPAAHAAREWVERYRGAKMPESDDEYLRIANKGQAMIVKKSINNARNRGTLNYKEENGRSYLRLRHHDPQLGDSE